MAEITLGDLLRWQLGYILRVPPGDDEADTRDRSVGWAVTIRASLPVLPPLRGGEIVVVPPKLLAQLEETESFTRRMLTATLAAQPIAALLVAPDFSDKPLPGAPLLVHEGAFPHDTENVLNRLLTERRAELYRIGSDLSRAMTASGMIGDGVPALLAIAAQATGKQVTLFDANGLVLETAPLADETILSTIPPPATLVTLGAQLGDRARELVIGGTGWLARRIQLQRAGAPRGALLLLGPTTPGTVEIDRLVLSQTAQSAEVLLARDAEDHPGVPERVVRETLVAELLLGQLGAHEAAARARLIGFDRPEAVRVVFVSSACAEAANQLRAVLPPGRRAPSAPLGASERAAIYPESRFEADWRVLLAAAELRRRSDPSLVMVVSDTVVEPARVSAGVTQARMLARLSRAGAIAGPVVDARDVEQLGVYGLLAPLLIGADALQPAGAERLAAFVTDLLGPLEAHDSGRDGKLVATLDVYLRFGGALASAARAAGVHRNTLSYRLGRIADLTGRDLSDPRTRLLLQLALAARSLSHVNE